MSELALSKDTMEVLKNFSTINSNILIKPGNQLMTMNISKTIVGVATDLVEEFPAEFPIYNLIEFLSALALFKDPILDFSDNMVTIKEKSSRGMKVKYMAASKAILVYPKNNKVREPDYEVSFNLSAEDLDNLLKSSAVIGAPDLEVLGNQDGIKIKISNRKLSSKGDETNDVEIIISTDPQPVDYVFYYKIENFKMTPGEYEVSIGSKGLTRFASTDRKYNIFITNESDSTYGS